ncbi:MAG TPA: NrfD/PsrC family molybdoenzyme membrane anchor subunit [Verrucomicrobiae bacterium]|nr:NrfD/PsrC family molybdoenzyme membrane anchor subunit [Verrucomicrobiae bacterium]
MQEAEPEIPPLPEGYTYATVSDKISSIVLGQRRRLGWFIGFGVSFLLVMLLFYAIGCLLVWGVGIWGINIPVAWGFAIVNFVWWIGIGHAGTLISAILLLLHQRWRTSINRFAEAMTIFAVACAGMFPLLHLGRPWLFYWLFPYYPSYMGVWPQFRSPLVWDVFAVSTYFTVSVLFWYVGMIPDLATLRDRARTKFKQIAYGIMSFGWRGSAIHWSRYEMASLLLAGLATPLVVSVHSVVSLDFTIAIVPGWHSTIFPPYFVAGAIYSGFAMVLTLAIPLRKFYHLEEFITLKHLDNCGKLMLATGLVVGYGYFMETFMAMWSGDIFDKYMIHNRELGPYWFIYTIVLLCNVIIPQALWSRRVRRNVAALFALAIIVNVGMWTERFMIVVVSLHRDFTPSAWGLYIPTRWDWAVLVGSLGLFAACFYLFVRYLPAISIFETRRELAEEKEEAGK